MVRKAGKRLGANDIRHAVLNKLNHLGSKEPALTAGITAAKYCWRLFCKFLDPFGKHELAVCLGKFLVDGEKLVNEVVCGAGEIDKIFVDSTKLADFDYILSKFNGRVVPVTSKVMASLSETNTPQGIVAEVFMRETGEFSETELKQAKRVLSAAAQTYIATSLTQLIYFLRFLSYAMIFSDRR